MSNIRFRVESIDGLTSDIQSTVLAAVIYAFDVPLAKDNPYSTQAGDGIPGKNIRVTWHFQSTPEGNSPKIIANRYKDDVWQAKNPTDPLTRCRVAFDAFFGMKKCLKEKRGIDIFNPAKHSTRVESTRLAACLVGMGHPIAGWHWNDYGAAWHFDQAAGVDAVLIHDEHLIDRLPDEPISFVKGAIMGHAAMMDKIFQIQNIRVEHKGRIAVIGKHIPQKRLDALEKILYRK